MTFFEVNMAKDNWQLVSLFRAPRMLMLYRKDARWCVINIFEKEFYQTRGRLFLEGWGMVYLKGERLHQCNRKGRRGFRMERKVEGMAEAL